jgi:hypothetical protein
LRRLGATVCVGFIVACALLKELVSSVRVDEYPSLALHPTNLTRIFRGAYVERQRLFAIECDSIVAVGN